MTKRNFQGYPSKLQQQFFNNRVINRRRQAKYWMQNWRAGLIRLLERILIRVNISDRLGGDLTQFNGFSEFYSQVLESKVVNEPAVLDKIVIEPLGSTRQVVIPGISLERRIMRLQFAKVDTCSGLITTDAGLVVDSTLPKWQKLLYMGGMADAFINDKKKIKEIQGRWAILPQSDYYFHTVTEDICSLLAIREVYSEFKILIYQGAPPWALELLKSLGFETQVVDHRKVRVEELLCATRIETFSKVDFQRFSTNKPYVDDYQAKSIFLSRGNLSRSDKELEVKLLQVLEREGFEVVFPENFSIKEQIRIFNSAQRIVSFHGGALSNLVWCKKGTKVLEIFNHPYRSYDFARIAAEGELRYFALDLIYEEYRVEQLEEFLNV